ncbi:MAG: ABC transporter permease subunit [Pirellulales bacterium]
MFRWLLKKYLRESQWLWVSCALMLLIFPWMRIWTVCQFELSGFAPLLDQIRNLEKFSPVPLEQFLTYEGVVALTYDEPILVLCILVWSIARGSDVVSGEIGRGTMEMMLAQPVRRSQLLAAHGLVTILGLIGLVLAAHLGLFAGIQTNSVLMRVETPSIQIPGIPIPLQNPFATVEKTRVPLAELVPFQLYSMPSIHLLGLGWVVLGLSVLCSSWERLRSRTIGTVLGIYVTQLLLYVLAKSAPKLGALKVFTFLSAYQPDWTVQVVKKDASMVWAVWVSEGSTYTPGPLGFALILFAIGAIAYAIGAAIFCKRDIPAPL